MALSRQRINGRTSQTIKQSPHRVMFSKAGLWAGNGGGGGEDMDESLKWWWLQASYNGCRVTKGGESAQW